MVWVDGMGGCVSAAASLVTLEDGTRTAEMVLHSGDQHVYEARREPRASNLHLLWHHLTVRGVSNPDVTPTLTLP